MFKKIQWRIAISFIVLILASVGVLGAYLVTYVREAQIDNLRFRLEEEARITAEASSPLLVQGGDADILAKKLGQQIEARVTIIAPDGVVLGDSHEDPAMMENHATRPEVQDALTFGLGESTRYSTTLGEQMMYVAVPVSSEGMVLGIARTALLLTTVEESVKRLTVAIILALVVITCLTIVAAGFIARGAARPIKRLTQAANRIAGGQVGQEVIIDTRDEVGQLGSAFNEMSSSLKKLIDEVSAERAKLFTILDTMIDGVIVTDIEGKVVISNRAAEKVFGFVGKNVIGKSLIEAVRDHEVDAVFKLCLKTNKEQSAQFETSVMKRFVRIIAVPIVESKVNEILFLFQDLTELRNLQTMRKELVGNISHELRTPIAGIKAMVETLSDGAVDDKEAANNFLLKIEAEIDRLTQMVSELTELTRIETGKAELKIESLNLNSLIEQVVEDFMPLAARQQVTISVNLSPDLPEIKADIGRIRQTIINLVHNAIKFNKIGGSVVVSTRTDNNAVTVDISDTGTGISQDDLPHVFERFYKADRARSQGGSGLGLAIAKHTIHAHSGTIRAMSDPGKGSTFSFSLPLILRADSDNLS